MDSRAINACLAEFTPHALRLGPRMIRTWLQAGWMTETEAIEWRIRIDAWRDYYELTTCNGELH